MVDYVPWLNKSDKELLAGFFDSQKGSEASENAKFILETRNAQRLGDFTQGLVNVTNGLRWATWVLVIFTAAQVVIAFMNWFLPNR